MTIKLRLFLTLSLFAILLASACTSAGTEAPSQPLSVATSRGPDLHATDPTTVSLAAGQLHFVEFFRFT